MTAERCTGQQRDERGITFHVGPTHLEARRVQYCAEVSQVFLLTTGRHLARATPGCDFPARPMGDIGASLAETRFGPMAPPPARYVRRPDLQEEGSRLQIHPGYSTRAQQNDGQASAWPAARWRGDGGAGAMGWLGAGSGDALDDGGVGHAAALAHGLQAVTEYRGPPCGGRARSSAGRRTRRAGGRWRWAPPPGFEPGRVGACLGQPGQRQPGRNASLTSNAPMSPTDRPDFFSAFRVAGIGAVSMITGSSAGPAPRCAPGPAGSGRARWALSEGHHQDGPRPRR